ncbi:MAG: PQQ-dependent sugar dehydrogenase [Solirubrobacterales bacterium]
MVRAILVGALAGALGLPALAAPAGAMTVEGIGRFDEPIYVTSDPGDANRLFVVERAGTVREARPGTAPVLFADLGAAVGCGKSGCLGERGLLSIALAPDFDTSGRLFADYAGEPDGTIHVVELIAPLGGTAVGAPLRQVLEIPHPGKSNHNGGQLQFGPEGDLFISTGDGGGANDELENSQDLGSLLGKILRIDPTDPDGAGPRTYSVPAGNPFAGEVAAPYDTIWSYGLRNPFRFSFDRGGGGIWIGDVGQSAREEIDFGAAPGLGGGANYGWNCFEGRIPGPATDPGCSTLSGAVAPIFDYPHADPGGGGAHGCAVIGGYLVRDRGLGTLYGRYLYGDLCGGELRSFDPSAPYATDCDEGVAVANLNSFGEDAAGRLYTVSGDGVVGRLVASGSDRCAAAETSPTPPLRPAYAGIRAFSRHVLRGDRALITVWVSPCANRQGERVKLFRGPRAIAGRPLSRACTARFRPRIRSRANFRARITEGGGFEAATSRQLTIKPRRAVHRKRRHHRAAQ